VTDLALAELAARRLALNDAVLLHEQSLERFFPTGRCWFALTLPEQEDPPDEREDGRPHHLSTSASCYESLADRHPAVGKLDATWLHLAREFASHSLKAPTHVWRSEGAAEVYCRVRALPATIRFAETLDGDLGERVQKLLLDAWGTVDLDRPADGGLAERALYDRDGNPVVEQDPRSPGYPPNAFLTYWGLKALECYRERRTREGATAHLAR